MAGRLHKPRLLPIGDEKALGAAVREAPGFLQGLFECVRGADGGAVGKPPFGGAHHRPMDGEVGPTFGQGVRMKVKHCFLLVDSPSLSEPGEL